MVWWRRSRRLPGSHRPPAIGASRVVRYTDPATKSDLDLVETRLKTEITRQVTNLMMGAFLALTYFAFWVMVIVEIATDAKSAKGS